MNFNPDSSKQAQEVIFSRKTKKEYHVPFGFNNDNVSETNSEKHLGVKLDNRLTFEDHLKMILNKVKKLKDFSANFIISYQDLYSSLYRKVLLEHIPTIVTSYMTASFITHHFIKH